MELLPARQCFQNRQVVARPLDRLTTTGEDQDLGVRGLEILPGDADRVFPGRGEDGCAAGAANQLGSPMAGVEDRLGPFHEKRGRAAQAVHPGLHVCNPPAELPADQVPPRAMTHGLRNRGDTAKNVL